MQGRAVNAPSRTEADADRQAAAGRLPDARRLLERAAAETPGRAETWMKLAAMCGAGGDHDAALGAIERALALGPLDFPALLAKARTLDRLGREDQAGLAYGHALAQRPAAASLPAPMRAAIAHAETRYAAFQSATVARLAEAVPADSRTDAEEEARVARFCSNIARTTRVFHQEPSHFHYPGLPVREFHDSSRLPWLATLEAAFPVIKAEFEAVLAAEASVMVPYIQYPAGVPLAQWEALNKSRDWSAIHLLENGRRIESNARHCPRTLALLETLPQPRVPERSPNAMFSLLAPRTRIPPHTGVANTRLVCHLPLVVPAGCGFRVGAETRTWREGTAFVFDDTIEHEAWNDSDALRVVLIFDVWAWGLSEAERRAVAAILPASDPGGAGAGL